MSSLSPLGILAGGGTLPGRLAQAALATGRPVLVVAFEGHSDPAVIAPFPHVWRRLGQAAAILDALHAAAVQEVVFAGPVRRPSLRELRPDWKGMALLTRLGMNVLGDDGLLRAVAAVLEEEGFRVVGIPAILADLLMPAGPLGTILPDEIAWRDIRHGVILARTLGRLDVGQAVVVQDGLVLGLEAIEGTDALLARCAGLRRPGPGGVLVKMKKPQQDDRLDLPTAGLQTVEAAAAAGLRGLALEAGGTLLLEREAVETRAAALGLFVVGVAAQSEAQS